jgi:FkbM family methyltransferase
MTPNQAISRLRYALIKIYDFMFADRREVDKPAQADQRPTDDQPPKEKGYFNFLTPNGRRYTLRIDPEADAFQLDVADNGAFSDVPQLLWRLLNGGDTLIDLGANIGTVGIPLATKGVNVYAIDILAQNIEQLRVGADRSDVSVQAHCCAVWDRDGEVSITGTSAWGQVDASGTQTVTAVTVDTFIEQNNVGPVAAIKMDIEGAELEALRGATALIHREHPDIVFESNVLCYARRYSAFDLLAPLWQAGYRLYRLRHYNLLCPIQPGDIQECIVADYLATTKTDDELWHITRYQVRPAINEELISSILRQRVDPPVCQLYVAAIADTLPQAVRDDKRVRPLLQEWTATHRENELTSLLRQATAR